MLRYVQWVGSNTSLLLLQQELDTSQLCLPGLCFLRCFCAVQSYRNPLKVILGATLYMPYIDILGSITGHVMTTLYLFWVLIQVNWVLLTFVLLPAGNVR